MTRFSGGGYRVMLNKHGIPAIRCMIGFGFLEPMTHDAIDELGPERNLTLQIESPGHQTRTGMGSHLRCWRVLFTR